MTGTVKTRAQLAGNFDSPFATTRTPKNQDFQDLVASCFNLADDFGLVELALKGARTVMTGHETFTQASGNFFARDPGGADRNVDPSGTFVNGTFIYVVNLAAADERITFDSTGIAKQVHRGERVLFGYVLLTGWIELGRFGADNAPFAFKGSTGVMAGDETFAAIDGNYFERDPNGVARNFNPSGRFRTGTVVYLVNTAAAAFSVTFNSTGLNQAVAQNQRGIFGYNGAAWRKIFVG